MRFFAFALDKESPTRLYGLETYGVWDLFFEFSVTYFPRLRAGLPHARERIGSMSARFQVESIFFTETG